MASWSDNSNQNEEYGRENGDDSDIVRNITEDTSNIELSKDQFHQEFYKSINFNHLVDNSTSLEFNSIFCDIYCDKIEKGSPKQETKECGMQMKEVNQEDDKPTNVDMSLSLSPSDGGVKSDSEDESQDSSNQSEISSPTSQLACMSLGMNAINQDLESSNQNQNQNHIQIQTEADLPSLILMGCSHCHIYVMVSEVEPKCPKCMGSVLIDMFRESPAKRSRSN